MNDEIIREIWQIKDAIGKEFNYNLRSMGAELKRRQNAKGKQIVDLSLKRKKRQRISLKHMAEQLDQADHKSRADLL
ncbi:MAG: hypothetical protein J7K32_03825 [Deltaproteobacteria bacterium]|nr:hypothetical protein [Deltaproteobacteria bacterium]